MMTYFILHTQMILQIRVHNLNSLEFERCGTYEHVGEYSISQQSNAGKIFLAQPRGITIDNVNNRLIVGNYFRHGTTILDYNLGFIKETGGSTGTTRLEGAVDAIKAVVTDSSLTAGVNFGFGTWNSKGGRYGGWDGDITNGSANPCLIRMLRAGS